MHRSRTKLRRIMRQEKKDQKKTLPKPESQEKVSCRDARSAAARCWMEADRKGYTRAAGKAGALRHHAAPAVLEADEAVKCGQHVERNVKKN